MKHEQARVLIVDDAEVNRDMLARRLKRQGYAYAEAENGLQALEKLGQQDFDLIILDIMMPYMDGYQVLERLQAHEAWRHIPVIVVSALDDVDSVVRCIELGAEDYLFKPFNSTLLRARISASLEKKWLRDQEQAYLAAIKREMELGRQIQSDFLPDKLPQPPGWQIAASFHPAYEVAGDFYDVFPFADDRLGFIVGDVSGKGVGAAIFMALIRSLLRAFVEPDVVVSPDILNAVRGVNRYIVEHHQHRVHMFATLFFGVVETKTGSLAYVNAGHFPPILVRANGTTQLLDPSGPLVGITEEIAFEERQTRLEVGDVLLVYTDGITEATNREGELFGRQRLQSILDQPGLSAIVCLERVEREVHAFLEDEQPSDDVTMVVLGRTGND